MSSASLHGYSTGPMVTSSRTSFIDAKLLNNDRKMARVRIKQYDLLAEKKELVIDYALDIPPRGSCYLGLVLLDTWEVQIICNSPLVRCWVGAIDDDLNLQPPNVVLHTQLLRFTGSSLKPVAKKRRPEVFAAGYRS